MLAAHIGGCLVKTHVFVSLSGTSGGYTRLEPRIFRVSELQEDSGEENLQRPSHLCCR